jgi:hypothetical protein
VFLYVRLIALILSSTIVFSASQTPSMKLEVRDIISEFFIKVYFINRKKYQKREIDISYNFI